MRGIKGHILVVDDNEDNRIILEHFLENAGYAVETAANGREGLDAIRQARPAAVLLDVMMPKMSGLEVLQQLRGESATESLPVIMVTARSESKNVVEALRAGASDFVSKPIDYDVLVARLETHLRLARMSRELTDANRQLLEQMRAARSVQESLMPKARVVESLPASYGIEIAGLWRPSTTLGGDFWDLVSLADGSLGLLLISFQGAGMIPSLHTFRMKSFLHGQCVGIYNTSLTLSRINTQLCSFLPENDFATALYVRFDPHKNEFTLSSGGGPSPLIWRADTQSVERSVVHGAPLGAYPESAYREAVMPIRPGDVAVYFTEGLINFGSRQLGRYSEKRLGELLSRNADKSPAELATLLDEDLGSLEGPASGQDDVTAVIARLATDPAVA